MRDYRLSQHFLRSPRLALVLIGHSNLKKRDLVVEIGAGSGVITSALAHRVSKVIAIEPDAATATKLRDNLKRHNITNVEVIEKDFRDFHLPDTEYKIFANPPFHLSSEIFHYLLEANNPPAAIYLILQKQFALKLLNNARHYTSQLGYELTKSYDTKIRLPLKSTDFTPPPAVPCPAIPKRSRRPPGAGSPPPAASSRRSGHGPCGTSGRPPRCTRRRNYSRP